MRLTSTQIYMLQRLHCGVFVSELRKWDQRSLRGLFVRGLMHLDRQLNGSLTSDGEEVFQECHRAKMRKNKTVPLFGGRVVRDTAPMVIRKSA